MGFLVDNGTGSFKYVLAVFRIESHISPRTEFDHNCQP